MEYNCKTESLWKYDDVEKEQTTFGVKDQTNFRY